MNPHLLITDDVDAATLLEVLRDFGCTITAERDGSLSVTPPAGGRLPEYFVVLIELRVTEILELLNDDSGAWQL